MAIKGHEKACLCFRCVGERQKRLTPACKSCGATLASGVNWKCQECVNNYQRRRRQMRGG